MGETEKGAGKRKKGGGAFGVVFGNDTAGWALDAGLLLLRVATGVALFMHGAQKGFGWFGGHGFNATLQMVQSLHFPAPMLFTVLLILAEALGGLLLIAGVVTRIVAVGMLVTFYFAITKVVWGGVTGATPGSFFDKLAVALTNNNFDLVWLLFALGLFFLLSGAGRCSLMSGHARK